MDADQEFIQHLHNEKEVHKEHRHKHILYKLILTGSFFGIGQIGVKDGFNNYLLFVIPFIAMVHDIYIAGEHFKVQRIGSFMKSLNSDKNIVFSKLEVAWENYVCDRRENWAYKASLLYTLSISVFCGWTLYFTNLGSYVFVYWIWIGMSTIFFLATTLRVMQLEIRVQKIFSRNT